MLVELMVENLAVIERLRVRFHSGFHVLSGETGSGKSIVVDALGLLFGGRASAEMVRTGCERARVSGIFELPGDAGARTLIESLGVGIEEGEILLEREILANGKSRAFAASRPITAGLLRDLAPALGDIHGQHGQQRLFDRAEQLEMLDEFARARREPASRLFEAWHGARKELEALDQTESERLRLADLWSYQVKEIEGVSPKAGEDETLEHERKLLQNVTRLEENAAGAYEALYDSPSCALTQIRQAHKRIEELSRIDTGLAPLGETLRSVEALLQDVAYTLRDYLGRLEADPARLDQVESRLEALARLKRKYGGTLGEVLEFHETARRKLESAVDAEAHRGELRAREERAAADYRAAARELSEARREAAARLERQVEQELAALAMEGTRFRIAFSEGPWTANGLDAVEFLIAPNPGEEPRALDRIASGGELSRVALALKACVALPGQASAARRTLVFDEVDAGIGGRAAETVGRRLKQIAATNQVLCVTHLAQIAGFADHHYTVEKREERGRVVAAIEELEGEARTREISRMLSGRHTPEALKHAEQLIRRDASG